MLTNLFTRFGGKQRRSSRRKPARYGFERLGSRIVFAAIAEIDAADATAHVVDTDSLQIETGENLTDSKDAGGTGMVFESNSTELQDDFAARRDGAEAESGDTNWNLTSQQLSGAMTDARSGNLVPSVDDGEVTENSVGGGFYPWLLFLLEGVIGHDPEFPELEGNLEKEPEVIQSPTNETGQPGTGPGTDTGDGDGEDDEEDDGEDNNNSGDNTGDTGLGNGGSGG